MALKAIYDTQEEIPEEFRSLYTERDEKWELTEVEGIKTQADVDRVQEALVKERDDHKETKAALKTFEGIDVEKVKGQETELEQLRAKVEAGAGAQFDEEKFNTAVDKATEAKIKTEVMPLRRQVEELTTERDALQLSNDEHKAKDLSRTISDSVRSAAVKAKVVPTAVDDVLLMAERIFEVADSGSVITRDNVGVTPGISADIWLGDMQERRPHWWPQTQGGGSGGGAGGFSGKNPFSHEHWNMTEQGTLIREDREKAERLAQAAGTNIGGRRPPPKKAA